MKDMESQPNVKAAFVNPEICLGDDGPKAHAQSDIEGPSKQFIYWPITSTMLPYRIFFGKPEGEVLWIDPGLPKYDKPMFNQYILEQIEKAQPGYKPLVTNFDTLIEAGNRCDSIYPTGFIFHVSRCGSTLISNALKGIEGAAVISEPAILSQIVLMYLESHSVYPGILSREKCKELMQAVILILGHKKRGNEKHLFIKFTSWNIFLLPMIRELWPDVPFVFAFRNPVEVFNSIVSGKISWMEHYKTPQLVSTILNEDERECASWSFNYFIIRFLSGMYDIGLKHSGEALLIDYSNDKLKNIDQVIRYFKLKPSEREQINITTSLNVYSKDPKISVTELVNKISIEEETQLLIKINIGQTFEKLSSLAMRQNEIT